MGTRRDPQILSPILPSFRQKYIRVPAEYAHRCIMHILRENFGLRSEEIKHHNLGFNARLGGFLGVDLKVQLSSEGEVTLITLRFSYKRVILTLALIFIIAAVVSLSFHSALPLVAALLAFPTIYRANLEANRLLGLINETAPLLEREFERQSILKERKRLREFEMSIDDLYKRLCRRHMEVWGSLNVLEYKLREYQSKGFSHEEAILKVAEEEGMIEGPS